MSRAPLVAALTLAACAAYTAAQPPAVHPAPAVMVLDHAPTPHAAPGWEVSPDAGEGGWGFGGIYGSGEYLLWWVNGMRLPPLVTTGPAQFPVAFLGNPGTVLLFGGTEADQGPLSGGQFLLGAWIDCDRKVGIEASGFFLGERNDGAAFSSSQFPVLARPFINANRGTPSSEFAAFPGIAEGDLRVNTTTQLWGVGPRLRCNALCGDTARIDLIGGFQYVELEESLGIVERVVFSPTTPDPNLAGNRFLVTDSFATRNEFYGGLVGVDASAWWGRVGVSLFGQVALGSTHQVVEIRGQQNVAFAAGGGAVFPGALLALPGTNIGRFTRDSFSVIPRAGANLAFRLTERVSVYAGYSFLYWNNVVRPGDQIDLAVDVNRIPNFGVQAPPLAGTPRPTVLLATSDFWAHGISAGVNFSW